MNEETSTRGDVFSLLSGPRAQILIVAGLILLLVAPLIPRFKSARVARAQTELSQVDTLIALEMDDLQKQQEREQKADLAAVQRENANPIGYGLGGEEYRRQLALRAEAQAKREQRESDRQKVLEEKQEELRKKYDSNALRRDLVYAQVAASGMSWHHLLAFFGNLMLLLGLLVFALSSTGMSQKIAMVMLFIVLFSALSGISLNFVAAGNLGENSAVELLKTP